MSAPVDYEAKYRHLQIVLKGVVPVLQDHVALLNHVAARMTGATGHCSTMARDLTDLKRYIEKEVHDE